MVLLYLIFIILFYVKLQQLVSVFRCLPRNCAFIKIFLLLLLGLVNVLKFKCVFRFLLLFHYLFFLDYGSRERLRDLIRKLTACGSILFLTYFKQFFYFYVFFFLSFVISSRKQILKFFSLSYCQLELILKMIR